MINHDSPTPSDCYILANGHLYPPPSTIINEYLPSIEQLCQCLKAKFFKQEAVNQRLQKENDQFKSSIWEKEEVSRLKSRYEQMHEDYLRGFPITKEQQTQITTWRAEHNCRYRNKKIGNYYHYTFTPTPIGVAGEIVCSCGEKYLVRSQYARPLPHTAPPPTCHKGKSHSHSTSDADV